MSAPGIKLPTGFPRLNTEELKNALLLVERPLPLDRAIFTFAYVIWGLSMVTNLVMAAWAMLSRGWINLYIIIGVQVAVALSKHWFVVVRAYLCYQPAPRLKDATHIQVTSADYTGAKEIVPLQRRAIEELGSELSFEFRKQRFCWDEEARCFEKLRYPTQETFGEYARKSGHGSDARAAAALEKWGPNTFEVPLPQFRDLLIEQLLAPFFVFQVFSVGLWCLDEYLYYSLFTLGMLVVFECTTVLQRMRSLRELRTLQTPKQALLVHRGGRWDKLPGDALLPGDVISIGRPSGAKADAMVVPADMLLLAGTCIVEEAVLTGESTPQWKTPVGAPSAEGPSSTPAADANRDGGDAVAEASGVDPAAHLNVKRDKALVLFGGTKILQHTPDKNARLRTPDGGCLAVVLSTGFETAQGRLMRTILYSTQRVTANNWEVGLFILFLLFFAVVASGYFLYFTLQDPERDRFKIYLHCTMIITAVVPPELPMELSMAVNASLLALVRRGIFCTEPFRIPLAGKVEVCCFDKTGTLTSDNMVLEGVVPPEGGALQRDVAALSAGVQRVLAACQSLISLDGQLVGDPLEKIAFQATGWAQSESRLTPAKQGPGPKGSVTIVRRFHFSSSLKRMSCIVKVEDGSELQNWVVAKGAPEVILQHLAAVPANYETCYKSFAAQGARVIALAHRQLQADDCSSAAELRAIPRAQAESGLHLVGFAVLSCPLKPESLPACDALRNASHQLVMITGDAALTACHAAAALNITDRPTLILTHIGSQAPVVEGQISNALPEPDTHFRWQSPDEGTTIPFSRQHQKAVELASEWDLCIAGDGLQHLQQSGCEADFIPLTQVFARTSPEQKELILQTLRSKGGMTTLMCGDGTNDVGALKTAHVGVALLAPREPGADQRKPGQGPPPAASPAQLTGAEQAGRGAAGRGQQLAVSRGRGRGRGRSNDVLAAARGGAASVVPVGEVVQGPAAPGKPGPGSAMLERLQKAGKPITPQMQKMADALDSMDTGSDGQVPMVKPGDASMASPFTAKAASVMPCTDIVRQGRATLVTTVQMFKILGLLCLQTAYSLSVQYLQGIKMGDVQLTLMAFLSAGLFFVISNAKPMPTLSAERPHSDIFCAYVFLSILGQCAMHTVFLVFCYNSALAIMPKDQTQAPDGDFQPNLVNTVCWLVSYVTQLSTFAANYQGEPFNLPIRLNRGLANVLQFGGLLFVILTIDMIPGIAAMFSLVPIPQPLCRHLLMLAAADAILCYSWEQMLRRLLPASRPLAKGYMAHLPLLGQRSTPDKTE